MLYNNILNKYAANNTDSKNSITTTATKLKNKMNKRKKKNKNKKIRNNEMMIYKEELPSTLSLNIMTIYVVPIYTISFEILVVCQLYIML